VRAWDLRRAHLRPSRGSAQSPGSAVASLAARLSEALPPAKAPQAPPAAGSDPGSLFLVQGGVRAAKERRARVYFTVR